MIQLLIYKKPDLFRSWMNEFFNKSVDYMIQCITHYEMVTCRHLVALQRNLQKESLKIHH